MKRLMKILTIIQAVLLVWSCAALAGAKEEGGPRAGSFCLVGTGPGDADLLTARAVSVIRGADTVLCDSETRERLAGVAGLEGKQVIGGYGGLSPFYGKECNVSGADEQTGQKLTCEEYHKRQRALAALVRKSVSEGKKVVMLSQGDPTLYGQDAWTLRELADLHPMVVPGVSAFNAANAVLQVRLGEVIITTPVKGEGAGKRKDSIENLAAHQRATLVIFMPGETDKLLTRLSTACPSDMPLAVVSHAGQKGKTTVIHGTLGEMSPILKGKDMRESLIYVGKSLKGVQKGGNAAPNAQNPGKFYLVGMGPGDPDLATLRALRMIREADVIFAHKRLIKLFEKELSGKTVIEGYHRLFPFYGKDCSQVTERERARERMSCEEYHQKQAELGAMVRKAVAEGKTVAMLDSGDPLIYGPCSWTLKEFKDIPAEAIPGLSCFNAANAALAQEITNREKFPSIILASGWSVDEMAPIGTSIVLFTMRTQFRKFIDTLSRNYPARTPVAIVSSAGYADKEKVVRGSLDKIMDQVGKDKRPFAYMIYAGDFLERSKP